MYISSQVKSLYLARLRKGDIRIPSIGQVPRWDKAKAVVAALRPPLRCSVAGGRTLRLITSSRQ